MSAVTADMLRDLSRELGRTDPSWEQLEKIAGPVLQIFGRYRDTNPGCGDDWEDLVEFLEARVVELVKSVDSKDSDDGALGAVLWHKVQVVLLSPEERKQKKLTLETLGEYWGIVGKDGWVEWRNQYGFSKTRPNPFLWERTKVYKLVAKGCEALAEHLNRPITQWDRIEGGNLDMALSEYRKVMRAWLSALPDHHQLTSVYVQPRLVEITRGERKFLIDEELFEWLEQGESVLMQGAPGMGKSMLLRKIGLRLLDAGYVPVWMEPGDVVKDVDGLTTHLMGYLRGKAEIQYRLIHLVVAWGIREGRVVVLAEDGEKWNATNVRMILRLIDKQYPWYRNILVALRSEERWKGRGWRQVGLEWDAAKLRELMEKRGNSRLWNKLEAWVAKGLLLRRPWEYAMAAEVNDKVETPIEMLRMAVMNRARRAEKEGMNEQQVRRHLQTLRQEAWREIIQERDTWKPTRGKDISAANWGVQTRLMVEESEEKYHFAHNLLRGFLASEYPLRAKERKSPKEILESLIGVRDWESIVAWMGKSAVEDGKTEWVEQLVDAVAESMEKSWQRSGWLQGAKAVGPVLRLLGGYKVAKQVREEAKKALLIHLRPERHAWSVRYWLNQAVGGAFLALAPLSEETVELLWQRLYKNKRWQGLCLDLATDPEIARRLLEEPGQLFEIERPEQSDPRYGPQLLWQVARAPKMDVEALIGAAERIYKGEGETRELIRLRAIVGALSVLGTKHAARRLGDWLIRESERATDKRLDGKRADQIAGGLSQWRGDSQSLCAGLEIVMAHSVPWWVWRGYLRSALRIGKADVAAHLAKTAVEIETEWTEEQQIKVLHGIEAYGDERVVPYLAKWWHRLAESKDHRGQVWVSEALWGAENERGVLGRQSTRWLTRWLESADVSDDFLERVSHCVLRPRSQNQDNEDVVTLGRKWLERGAKEGRTTMMYAGAYLADTPNEKAIEVLQGSERHSETLGDFYFAGRLGRWEKVLNVLTERLRDGTMEWSLAVLVGEEQYLPALPTLIEYYLKGEEWIAQAGLYHFKWEDVDVCLETVWQMQGMKVDQRTANLLWKLGTPGAMGRVLEVMGQGVDDLYDFLPQVYREATWPLLADFVEESKNELGRWKVFGDIQSLWKIGEAWPWAVTGFFFHQLEDLDRNVSGQARQVLEGQIDQVEIRVWQGREWEYRDGLREAVLEGTEAQRCMGLRWLSLIPQEVGKSALERWELNQLLEIRSPELQRAALQYVTLQKRHDLLDRVREIADEMTSDRVAQYHHEDAASLQSAVVAALGMLEEDGEKLVQIALGERVIPTHGWINAQGQALDALITRRQYLEVLAQAVQEGRAPASWLTAASVAQGTFLEKKDSEIIVRRGEKTWLLREWQRLNNGQ